VAGFPLGGERGGEDRAETEAGDAEGSQLKPKPAQTRSFPCAFEDRWEDAAAAPAAGARALKTRCFWIADLPDWEDVCWRLDGNPPIATGTQFRWVQPSDSSLVGT